MRMSSVLRWIAVIPLTIAAWYLVLIVGLYTYFSAEEWLCPAGDMVSGRCHNHAVATTLQFLMHFFVGLSAVVVCFTAAIVSPSYKRVVTLVALASGSATATYSACYTQSWSLLAVALASGVVSAGIVIWRISVRRNA